MNGFLDELYTKMLVLRP